MGWKVLVSVKILDEHPRVVIIVTGEHSRVMELELVEGGFVLEEFQIGEDDDNEYVLLVELDEIRKESVEGRLELKDC
jgi:hypothetical protein